MPNKNYSRNAEQKLKMVKYVEKHGNASAAKHYELMDMIDEIGFSSESESDLFDN